MLASVFGIPHASPLARRLWLVSWLLVALPALVLARTWSPDEVPMVHLQDARRYVCNPDGIMGTADVDSADQVLAALERDKGVQSVVVVVGRMEGGDAYEFGRRIFEKYGVGNKKQSTGLVIVLATEDRKYYILTGSGLEGTLPDAYCKRIETRVMVPLLKQGEWGPAIVATVKAIDQVVRGDETLVAPDDDFDEGAGAALGFFVAFMILVLFFVILSASRSLRTCPKCGKPTLKVVSRKRLKTKLGWVYVAQCKCTSCGHTETFTEKDNDNFHSSGGGIFIPPIFTSGHGGGYGGGGFSGGSFGGGSFGGGGAGGSF